MSSRSCNHLTAGHLCSAVVHTSTRVGVPGHGPVYVNLCFAHKDATDPELEIMARAKLDRKKAPRPIDPARIVPGMSVQSAESGAIGVVRLVTDHNVRVSFPNGSTLGMSHQQLRKNYRTPQPTQ